MKHEVTCCKLSVRMELILGRYIDLNLSEVQIYRSLGIYFRSGMSEQECSMACHIKPAMSHQDCIKTSTTNTQKAILDTDVITLKATIRGDCPQTLFQRVQVRAVITEIVCILWSKVTWMQNINVLLLSNTCESTPWPMIKCYRKKWSHLKNTFLEHKVSLKI